MANWCDNQLTFSGPKDKIKAIWVKASGGDISLLGAMVPLADEDDAAVVWGTKWDIEIDGLDYFENGDQAKISGWFMSAWSPPIEAFQKFCDKNEGCFGSIEYLEPGNGFCGRWTSTDGDEEYSLDMHDLSNIPEDLQESLGLEQEEEDEEEYIDLDEPDNYCDDLILEDEELKK